MGGRAGRIAGENHHTSSIHDHISVALPRHTVAPLQGVAVVCVFDCSDYQASLLALAQALRELQRPP